MRHRDSDLVAASKSMALGTIVSRATGVLRTFLLVAAIGNHLNADIFDSANTIPNALYILVAGGVFNVVLVPQLIRAMRNDEDGGDAYANRIVTLGLLVLAVATVVLLAIIPLLLRIVFNGKFFQPGFEHQLHSATLLTALCLPQVFFYGAFVLVGQILNARGRFGPMMWAPIINNVVSCAVVVIYIGVFGSSNGSNGLSNHEAVLLGVGSTLGIAAQSAVLIPYLRVAGFHFRPRFDFRGVGLGHTLRIGMWTLFFVIANQIAYFTITRIGNASNVNGAHNGKGGAGSTVYNIGFLISQMPHGIITVSLATAMMPTLAALAADRRRRRMRLELSRTLRLALVIVAPLAVAVACFGPEIATITSSYGSMQGHTGPIGHTIQAFAPAMIFFTVHYLMLRGFYAAENTKTPFFIQAVISVVNIAAAFGFTSLVGPSRVSTMLALAYGAAYLVGSFLSASLLSQVVGRIFDAEMVRFLIRMALACALAAGIMLVMTFALENLFVDKSTKFGALVIGVIAGSFGAGAFMVAAKAMRIDELSYLAQSLIRRRIAQ